MHMSEDEELVDCITCRGRLKIVSFKTKQNNPNNTKSVFKCRRCGQTMIRFEVWPKKDNLQTRATNQIIKQGA